jgi:exonuclease V gamma subunit
MLRLAETPSALLRDIGNCIAQIRDPRARHWLVTPNRGRSEHIVQAWAHSAGIASHSQELELRTLLDQISAGHRDRFDFDALRLAVAQAMPELSEHPSFPVSRSALEGPLNAPRLAWANTLARAIDDALQCRRIADAWSSDSFLHALANHPVVKPLLEGHPSLLSPDRFLAAANAWSARWTQLGGIPYLWIQLDAGIPQRLLDTLIQTIEFLRDSGQTDRIHLFAITPSFDFWGEQLIRSRNAREGKPELQPERNPGGLLWSLGRCSQDLQNQITLPLLATGTGGIEIASHECPPSLLGLLQHSCRTSAPSTHLEILSPNDSSFTVHSTHNLLREMEVCRDRILQAFRELPDLRPQHILVLLANPQEQAPYVEAAFRGAPDVNLPFRLSGSGQTIPSSFATAVELLLTTLPHRITLPAIQSLLEHPLIAARFELNPASGDSAQALEWLQDAGFRWALNREQRASVQHLDEHRWNLRWAIQRLALGALVETQPDTPPSPQSLHPAPPTVPLERASGLSLSLLAKIAQLLEALEQAATVWSMGNEQSLAEWIGATHQLVADFIAPESPADQSHLTTLINSVLPGLARAANSETRIQLDGFIRLLLEKITNLNEAAVQGPGGIRIGDLRQLAGVPARVILIAGLDNDTFPRADERPAWHPLAQRCALGDPSSRDADRHALLLALLSAEERLVISFRGNSDEDQKPRPPSTALADILATVDTLVSSPNNKPAHHAILFRHPLNPFSQRAFQQGISPNQQGYNPADHDLATARLRRQSPHHQGPWSSSLSSDTLTVPTLEQLRLLIQSAPSIFLTRIGAKPPLELADASGADLIELDGLERWGIRDALLYATIEGNDIQHLHERMNISGRIPRGSVGEAIFQSIRNDIPPTERFAPSERITSSCRCLLNPGTDSTEPQWLAGTPRRGWYRHHGDSNLHYFSASAFNNSPWKHELLFKLEALTLAASIPDIQCAHGVFDGEAFCIRWDGGISPTSHLARLVPLFRLALQIPLPFWPAVSTLLIADKKSPRTFTRPFSLSEDRLDRAFESWCSGDFQSSPAESLSAVNRIAFRGLDNPLRWSPKIDTPFLQNPEAPLAWRIACFVADWMDVFPLEKTGRPSQKSSKKKS